MLVDKGLALACTVLCWEVLEALPVLEPDPVSEEMSALRTRSAASSTILRAACLSDRLVERRMSSSSSFSRSLTSRLQRSPLLFSFCCRARSFCWRNLSCTCSKVVIGLSGSADSGSVDPLPAETGVKED